MKIDGHPTQDIVEELARRGAVLVPGDASGPDLGSATNAPQGRGFWMYVSDQTYDTEIDEGPPLIV